MMIDFYKSKDRVDWDKFLNFAKNSHFMFSRSYMEYHKDKFDDFSLIARDENQEIVAILPANINNRTLYSHQGLSFGGLCIRKNATTRMVLDVFSSMMNFLKSTNLVDDFIYKRMPDFYTTYPSQEDLYALFVLDAKLYRRDVSAVIDCHQPLPISSMRKRHIKKAIKNNLIFFEEEDLFEFWGLLTEVLRQNHGVDPVHSLPEINSLKQNFPDNIKCFSARKDGIIVAGTIIFETSNVAHTQYLANGAMGRDLGALDFLINILIEKYSKNKKFISFGISTEDEGTVLNEGLISQKEGFGARTLVHDFYKIRVA